ncbi:MAG: 50S ribosomal protein L25 [Kiritimatiellae bacterium]|nr:50S ribosomal protein L25 [Kiritimatiellia bacterium]
MAEAITVKASPREVRGKGEAGRLRRRGVLPGVVYGSGEAAQMIELNEHDFQNLLRKHVSEHVIMDLQVEQQKPRKVLLKEVQHHPVTGRILHVDFREVSMTEKLRVEIPIELVGEPEGVTQQGGVLEHILREVEVECLPADIIERIDVDVTKLMIGDSLTVADIVLDPAKYTVISPRDLAIAAVAAPRVEEEPVAAEAAVAVEGEAAAEPEVIGEKEREEARLAKEKEKEGGQEAAKAEKKEKQKG